MTVNRVQPRSSAPHHHHQRQRLCQHRLTRQSIASCTPQLTAALVDAFLHSCAARTIGSLSPMSDPEQPDKRLFNHGNQYQNIHISEKSHLGNVYSISKLLLDTGMIYCERLTRYRPRRPTQPPPFRKECALQFLRQAT
jgi:hypothetical protein